MIQHLTLLITVVPALGGQLSASNFTPEVHCGRVQEGSLFVAASNGGQPEEVADIMCAVLTDEKPNYLVLSRVKEDAHRILVDRSTSFCAIRLGTDGKFRATLTACDPMRKTKVFEFTYTRAVLPNSKVHMYDGSLGPISLSRPAPIEVLEAAVFMGDDDEFRVAKVAPKGSWYVQRGDAFFPIPIECAPKRKPWLFKKLSRSRPVNIERAKARCDPGAGRWVTLDLDGDVYHLLFGATRSSKFPGAPFILVAKRREEQSLTFTLLGPVMRTNLESALKPFEVFHSKQIQQKKGKTLKKSRSEGNIARSVSNDESHPEILGTKSLTRSSPGKKRKLFRLLSS